MSDHQWYILGAGAIGCLWAGYWQQSGIDVILINPTPRKTSTLTLSYQHGIIQKNIQSMTVDELAASKTTINNLLVTTKAQHTVMAITAIKNNIAKQATLLILQNGMAAKKLPTLLPTQTLVTGITTDGAYRTDQLSVVHAGHGETFISDELELLKQLPTHFLTIKTCNDIEKRQWQKLAINCAINGLTVIYQCRNGELFSNTEAMQRIKVVCEEIICIAKSLGISDYLVDLHEQVEKTLRTTAENYSSMYQDIIKGQTTEIDYINGYICTLAKKLSISCEENWRIIQAVKQQELLHQG